jgi:hypothetical protein
LNGLFKLILAERSRALFFDLTGGHIPESRLNFLAPWKRGDHDIKLSVIRCMLRNAIRHD